MVQFILSHKDSKIRVFFLTCASVDFFAHAVQSLPALAGLKVKSLHGRMVQKKRVKTMEDFRKPERTPLLSSPL